jgi:hypothetical protein
MPQVTLRCELLATKVATVNPLATAATLCYLPERINIGGNSAEAQRRERT